MDATLAAGIYMVSWNARMVGHPISQIVAPIQQSGFRSPTRVCLPDLPTFIFLDKQTRLSRKPDQFGIR